jgi:acetolactate synthase-1/2/3 large subunit
VVHYRPRHLALSTEHPMHCGWDPHALLKDADVVLVVECDVPWIPREGKPKPDAKVIHVGPDPLFASYPLRGFRADLALTGAVAPTLQALWRAAQKQAVSVKHIEERRKIVADFSRQLREGSRTSIEPLPPTITGKWLSACVNRMLDEKTILVNEYPTVLEEMVIREPGRYFGNPSAGGLGWGMGAALGAKLASPDRTVICAVGDGAYMFGNPISAHYVGKAEKLPTLTVIYNNEMWNAVRRNTRDVYPDGYAARSNREPLTYFEPGTHYEKTIEAFDGHGETVTEAADLPKALDRALNAVGQGRQALLNVVSSAG